MPMPQPSAEIIVPTSVFCSTFSRRAFSTLRILPRIGKIAWKRRSRPSFAEPPAESPQRYRFRRASDRSLGSRSVFLEVERYREPICAESIRALCWPLRALAPQRSLYQRSFLRSADFHREKMVSSSPTICWTTEPTSLLPSAVWSALQIAD